MGHPNHWEEEVGWCSRWLLPYFLLLTHIFIFLLMQDSAFSDSVLLCPVCASQKFSVYLFLQRWPTRRATSFLMGPTRWTVPRTFTQQELFSSTAGPWMCTRPGSSTLSPKAPSTRPSIFWYTYPSSTHLSSLNSSYTLTCNCSMEHLHHISSHMQWPQQHTTTTPVSSQGTLFSVSLPLLFPTAISNNSKMLKNLCNVWKKN